MTSAKPPSSGPRALPTARNVPVIAVTTGINVGAMMIYAPVLSLILRDLGATDLVIGTANAAWLIFSAVCQLFGGRLADRLGRVPVIAWPGVFSGVMLALCSLARSWPAFVVMYAFYQAGHGVQGPVFASIIGESVPAAQRGRAFSRTELAVGAGVIIGPLIGSVLMSTIGVNSMLIVAGGLLVLAGTARLLLLRETRPDSANSGTFAIASLLRPPLSRVMAVLISVNALFMVSLWGPYISLHANDVMGLSRTMINQLASAGAAAGMVATYLAGHAVTRFGAPRVVRLAMPLLAAASILWAWQRATPNVIGFYILMYAAFEFLVVSSDTFRVLSVDEQARGRTLGAIGMANNLVIAPLLPLISSLRASLGSTAPFYTAILPAAVGFWAINSWIRHAAGLAPHPPEQVSPPV